MTLSADQREREREEEDQRRECGPAYTIQYMARVLGARRVPVTPVAPGTEPVDTTGTTDGAVVVVTTGVEVVGTTTTGTTLLVVLPFEHGDTVGQSLILLDAEGQHRFIL